MIQSYKRLFFSIIMITLGMVSAFATHNRAGEITYEQIDDLTIRATITTYTKTSSVDADRDSLQLFWGDGSSEFVYRDNGNGDPIDGDIKINFYSAEHTYPGRGTYTMHMRDQNRVANILNVNFPNSVNVPFYVETTFTLLNTQFQGFNNSAILLQAPLDFGCANTLFEHNPNAFDPDGDSLSYELAIPSQDVNVNVPDYSFPDEIAPGGNNIFSIHPVTGQITWNTPQLQGEYNIAIRINEYREGVLINSMVRDMQIFIEACEDNPPVITAVEELCVVAGEIIDIPILVDDMDEGQLVKLQASGGPLFLDGERARLEAPEFFSPTTLEARFVWETECNDVSQSEYQIVFRAIDNFQDTTGLADLKTLRIKVVAPEPQNVEAESFSDQIKISWDLPYDCEFTDDQYFQGFSVWRKEGSFSLERDTCSPGLEGTPYEKVVFLTSENDGERYFAFDDNVEKGITYCYRVLAEFALTTPTGNPFNRVQSLPSDEVCLQIFRDLPLITNVSVEETDMGNGSILVRWTKPLAADLDTIENSPPYRYQLWRATGIDGIDFTPVIGADFIINSFTEEVDTSFIDAMINTVDNAYRYQVAFYSANLDAPFGTSAAASSVFLSVNPLDEGASLAWEIGAPWNNIEYGIFRRNATTGELDSIDATVELEYIDRNLVNGEEFCYVIKAFDTYGIEDIDSPLINFSQEACTVPFDNEGPCAPNLQVSNICNTNPVDLDTEGLVNELLWSKPRAICGDDDVAFYNIYYAREEGAELTIVFDVQGEDNNEAVHNPDFGVAGCYQVSAVDFSGNEGPRSDIVCVDNCPVYDLPNTFTPNQDGDNDVFVPTINRFIATIDMKIFNRWGNKVFETNDPQINWDGRNLRDIELKDGVYYYTCTVFEDRVDGVIPSQEVLSGFIQIIR